MEPSKITGKVIVISAVLVSAIIGGVLGGILTNSLWQALLAAFFIGFGVYVVFLFIALISFYTAVVWLDGVKRDK
jgi:hypothetical protein